MTADDPRQAGPRSDVNSSVYTESGPLCRGAGLFSPFNLHCTFEVGAGLDQNPRRDEIGSHRGVPLDLNALGRLKVAVKFTVHDHFASNHFGGSLGGFPHDELLAFQGNGALDNGIEAQIVAGRRLSLWAAIDPGYACGIRSCVRWMMRRFDGRINRACGTERR